MLGVAGQQRLNVISRCTRLPCPNVNLAIVGRCLLPGETSKQFPVASWEWFVHGDEGSRVKRELRDATRQHGGFFGEVKKYLRMFSKDILTW